eukprot:CAMPEP_0204192538 /NCGR_PEP_ID=MMETSP0361-20130328/60953_1 /ASSEMBLY_ACC=CAM_ASM_000343 /TAXON_ID=268821 /ORGANISM="Scrippsiella Hangoei, Strain SHTV-5" /LENGTH=49 /DNA_ID= /DNA_START= /DNA_END= /DNA_ORIENTATION=
MTVVALKKVDEVGRIGVLSLGSSFSMDRPRPAGRSESLVGSFPAPLDFA